MKVQPIAPIPNLLNDVSKDSDKRPVLSNPIKEQSSTNVHSFAKVLEEIKLYKR